MRPFRFLFLVLIMTGALSSCGQTPASPTSTQSPYLSSQARVYLTAALDIMQQHSVNRKTINWTALRQETFVEADHAKTPADTYPAIKFALQRLGDHHSYFVEPQSATQPGTGGITPDQQPLGQLLPHGIGYLQLPLFVGDGQAANQYVQSAQEAIQSADQAGTCGWIVDLRNNFGGSMWPMLAAVGPILGEGTVGSFVYPDGSKQPWTYRDGQALLGQEVRYMPVVPAYHLKRPEPPVAVLTNSNTKSSGEAIVVAFRGRPSTRSFGQPTAGIPTDNNGYTLSDGAILWITVAVDADRTGQTYDSSISPDQEVSSLPRLQPRADDNVAQAVLNWLYVQANCQS